MPEIGRLVAFIDGDLSGLDKALKGAQRKLGAAEKTLTGVGTALSVGVTAPILGIGTAAVKVGAAFEQRMNQVRAVSGATGKDLEALENQAKELGRTTQFSASQSAEAMGNLAQAGFEVNDILGAMPSILQLAAASNTDLATATEIATNILNGYGLAVADLAHVNDVLVQAAASTNAELTTFGEAFKYVGPIAKSAGLDVEETTAAIGLLSNAGIEGSMAGTALRGAISRLINPTGEVAAVLERLGIKVKDSKGELLPLVDIVRQLERSGADTADMMALFGDRAGPAMAALVGQGSAALADLTADLEEADGVAQRIADVQMEGLAGSWTRLKSAWEGLMLSIADMGVLRSAETVANVAAVAFSGLASVMESLPAPVQTSIVGFAGFLAVLGPVTLSLGYFAGQIKKLLPLVRALPAALAAAQAGTLSWGAAALRVTPWLLGLTAAVGAAYAAQKLYGSNVPQWNSMLAKLGDNTARIAFLKRELADSTGIEADAIRELIRRLEEEVEEEKEAARFTKEHGDAIDTELVPALEDGEEVLGTFRQRVKDLNTDLDTMKSRLREVLDPLDTLRGMETKEQAAVRLDIAAAERDVRAKEREIAPKVAELEAQADARRDEADAIREQADAYRAQITMLQARREAIEEEFGAVKGSGSEADVWLTNVEAGIEAAKASIDAINGRADALDDEADALDDEADALREPIRAAEDHAEALRDQAEALQDTKDAAVDAVEAEALLNDGIGGELIPSFSQWTAIVQQQAADQKAVLFEGPFAALEKVKAIMQEINGMMLTVNVDDSQLDALVSKFPQLRSWVPSTGMETRHEGGPVEAGTPYVVRPDEEVFVPGRDGYVWPMERGGGMQGGNELIQVVLDGDVIYESVRRRMPGPSMALARV